MSDFIDYPFEEVLVTLDGKEYSADGTVCVEYIVHRASPSTGDRGGPEIMGFSDLSVVLTDDDGNAMEIPSGEMETLTVLMRQIIANLDQEYVLEEIDAQRGSFW
jgi:hypothetical protein